MGGISTTETTHHCTERAAVYTADFPGFPLSLLEQRQTFHVSRAGMALGEFLVKHVTPQEVVGRILDLGTGSGAIALLLRSLGATSVTATDVSAQAVETARDNELLNFQDARIRFHQGDLFDTGDDALRAPFDLVVFNPPGWRSPSPALQERLDTCGGGGLDLSAMFYGESVLEAFLRQLPHHLAPGGRAIVGFNSLLGVHELLARAEAGELSGGSRLRLRRLRRVELPLMMYTDEWAAVCGDLLQEFQDGGDLYGAEYVMRDQVLHWYYDITELTVVRNCR